MTDAAPGRVTEIDKVDTPPPPSRAYAALPNLAASAVRAQIAPVTTNIREHSRARRRGASRNPGRR